MGDSTKLNGGLVNGGVSKIATTLAAVQFFVILIGGIYSYLGFNSRISDLESRLQSVESLRLSESCGVRIRMLEKEIDRLREGGR